jgi:hypothetical protein
MNGMEKKNALTVVNILSTSDLNRAKAPALAVPATGSNEAMKLPGLRSTMSASINLRRS